MGEVKREADRAARSTWARWLARLGLVAKGATFGLVGLLAIKVAIEGSGKVEDRPGALERVGLVARGLFYAWLSVMSAVLDDASTTEAYTSTLHDALQIYRATR